MASRPTEFMFFILVFLLKEHLGMMFWPCLGWILLKISPWGWIADYIILSWKASIFSGWQTFRSKLRGDTFLNYKHMFSRTEPLTYKQLGNLLVSFGYNDSKYDEKYCYSMIYLGLDKWTSRHAVGFYLAMPVLIFEVKNISGSFRAKGTINPLGENLRLYIKRSSIEEISNKDIRKTLNSAIQKDNFYGYEIIQIFQEKHIIFQSSSETDISRAFFGIFEHVCSYLLLKIRCNVPMKIENSSLCRSQNCQSMPLCADNIIFDDNGQNLCVVEITRSSLFTEEERNSMPIDYLCYDETHGNTNNKLSEVMKQLQTHMIISMTRFGIVCDGYNLILLEYVNDLSYYKSGCHRYFSRRQGELPGFYPQVRARILNVHSSCPSFLEGLTFFLYEAKQAKIGTSYDEIFDYFHEALIRSDIPLRSNTAGEAISAADGSIHLRRSHRFRRKPDRYSPNSLQFPPPWSVLNGIVHKFLNWRSGAIILQRSSRNISTVCKIKAKYVRDVFLQSVYDEDYAVMKIYDPQAFVTELFNGRLESAIEYANKCFLGEKHAIHRLRNTKEFNSIYFWHFDVEVEYFHGYGNSMTGRTIISRFIKSEPIPQSSEVYEQARRQLELIHEAGVIHGDISLQNMFFANGKLYIYDFSHSSLMSEVHPTTARVMVQEDYMDLHRSFKKVQEPNWLPVD